MSFGHLKIEFDWYYCLAFIPRLIIGDYLYLRIFQTTSDVVWFEGEKIRLLV